MNSKRLRHIAFLEHVCWYRAKVLAATPQKHPQYILRSNRLNDLMRKLSAATAELFDPDIMPRDPFEIDRVLVRYEAETGNSSRSCYNFLNWFKHTYLNR